MKAVAGRSYLFTAVNILFKLIKYFQTKHLSMESIIILNVYICLFLSTTNVGGLMTNENIELFTRIVNYQAVSLCHIGIAVFW